MEDKWPYLLVPHGPVFGAWSYCCASDTLYGGLSLKRHRSPKASGRALELQPAPLRQPMVSLYSRMHPAEANITFTLEITGKAV